MRRDDAALEGRTGSPADGDRPAAPTGRGSRGFEVVLIMVYALFALSATARSLVQILREFDRAPLAYLLSLAAALTYIVVTVALIRGGRRSPAVLVLCLVELAGVLLVGTLTYALPGLFADATVWTHFGQGYGFVPLALPLVALTYVVATRRPGRAARAEAA